MFFKSKSRASDSLATKRDTGVFLHNKKSARSNSINVIPQKSILRFKVHTDTYSHVHKIIGRPAQTLYCLIKASSRGITAQEVSSWALRMSAYIHILRHDYGLDIAMVLEPHDGGNHGRYILKSNVEILSIK